MTKHFSIDRVNPVIVIDELLATTFGREYAAANRGNHREGGPTPADEKATERFHAKYESKVTRSGFAGSGTTVYTEVATGLLFTVDRRANSRTFYGTDHVVQAGEQDA